ncbi:hypothetical protein EPN18_00395 [bacterium]|nr:MAG: hypothetical protein EPN18_00395 [bacterium]
MCTPEKKRECDRNSGGHHEVMCPQCEMRPGEYEPSAWFQHIWFLYALQEGGYPFEKDDLTLPEWMDLGVLRCAVKEQRVALK